MTLAEFSSWVEFYKLFPFDDLHRYHRPAALIGASMAGDLDKRLEWLSPEPIDETSGGLSQADINTLKAFGRSPVKR